MFYRNLLVYRLTQPLAQAADLEAFEAALQTKRSREPASQELSTYGFVAPYGKGEDAPLLYVSNGCYLVATRKRERILPGGVITEELRERVAVIESEQLRKVYKKERDQIKDEIIQAFLPRAFLRSSSLTAAIDPVAGLVYVNTASPARAEDLLSTLREVLGSLPVRPVTVKVAPMATMTEWVKTEKSAPDFYVLDGCTLADTGEDGGTVRCQRQDLTSEEVRALVATGKQVTSLALAYKAALSFVLDDGLKIKGLKWEDLLTDKAAEDGGEDPAGQFDASFVLMMLTLRTFTADLFQALGGEELPQAV